MQNLWYNSFYFSVLFHKISAFLKTVWAIFRTAELNGGGESASSNYKYQRYWYTRTSPGLEYNEDHSDQFHTQPTDQHQTVKICESFFLSLVKTLYFTVLLLIKHSLIYPKLMLSKYYRITANFYFNGPLSQPNNALKMLLRMCYGIIVKRII